MPSSDAVHEVVPNTSKIEGNPQDESPGHANVQKSIVYRLQKDMAFRYKITRSFAVTWSMFLVGWLKGLIGPSFPEILYLTDTPLERGSAYLTVLYTCKILGHAVGGLLYDRVDKDVYSTVFPVINALVLVVFPWCRTYETMIVMFGVHGLMISSMEIGLITTTVNLWDSGARQTYLQITMFLFSIATIVSPIAIMPFLMSNMATVPKKTFQNFTENVENAIAFFQHSNETAYATNVGNQTFHSNSTVPTGDSKDQQSILYIGFAIAAVLVLSGAMPFACFFFSKRCSIQTSKDHHELPNEVSLLSRSESKTVNDNTEEYKVVTKGDTKAVEVLLLESPDTDVKPTVSYCDGNVGPTGALSCTQPLVVLLFIVSCGFGALHSAIEISMGDLMPTFCRNFLQWPASHGAMVVSLLYFFFTLGRIACALLVQKVRLTKVLGAFVVLIIIGSVGLSVSTNVYSTPGTWVSIGVIGLGIAACYPSQLGWTSQYLVSLSGKLTAILLCTMYLGSVIAPLLLSFLMTTYNYLFLCYSILTMSVMAFLCVVFMGLYVNRVEKDQISPHI